MVWIYGGAFLNGGTSNIFYGMCVSLVVRVSLVVTHRDT